MRLIDADALMLRVNIHGTNKFGMLDEDIREFMSEQPTIEAVPVVRCRECIHYDPPHIEKDGIRYEYGDMPEDAFGGLGTGLVNIEYGINVGGRCAVDYNNGYDDDKRVFRREDDFCSRGAKMDGGMNDAVD